MLLNLFRFFSGYVTISLTGNFTERFINICIARGLVIWNIRKTDERTTTVNIAVKDFLKVRSIAKKSKTKVRIREKHGLFMHLKKHRKRKFFFIGIVFFILFIFISTRFIWHIEIHGLTYTPEQSLIRSLKEAGVYPGVLKSRIDQNKVKNIVLLKQKDLSWLWVDIKGSKAIVNVSQRTLPPVIENRTPCDIIATKDGVIFSYTVTGGSVRVKTGDSVVQGQTLISGVVTSEMIPYRYTKASGQVWARTWYTPSDIFYPEIEVLKETGEKKTHRRINIFGFDINLFFSSKPPYDTYNVENTTNELCIFGKPTGIILKNITYTKTEKTKQTLNEAELLNYAKQQLSEKIKTELSEGAELLSRKMDFVKNPDGSYNIMLISEYKEQIGVSVEIKNPLSTENAP